MKTENYRGEIMAVEPQRHNDEFEKAIIKALLSGTFADRETMMHAVKTLRPEYFYNPTHRDCFRAVLDMLNGTYGVSVAVPDVMTFTEHIKTNADRYDKFRSMRDSDLETLALTYFDSTYMANGLYIVSEIVSMYKTRRRWELGVQLQKLSGEITDTKEERQKIFDQLSALEMLGNSRYEDLLQIPTREERIARFRDKPEALETSYQFDYVPGEAKKTENPLPFLLPSGAITVIAAPTSHGKSTFLRNLAIDIAKRYEDKSVLYFTFEESEEDVWAQFTNTYIGKRLHFPTSRHPQTEAIINYYKTGETGFIGGDYANITAEEFKKLEKEFSSQYLDSGRIRIFYRDYDLETLIEALNYAVSNIPTKAIFIDYIQILRASQKHFRQPRTEQLKEACISLKDFSVQHKIPVILASQLNRDAKTPLRMDNTQLAESSDIEKAANTVICLFNSNFKPKLYGKEPSKEEKEEIEALEKKGFKLGEDGKLFALVTKNRGSRGVGMYAIFNHHGYSGKIENEPKEEKIDFEKQGAAAPTSQYCPTERNPGFDVDEEFNKEQEARKRKTNKK